MFKVSILFITSIFVFSHAFKFNIKLKRSVLTMSALDEKKINPRDERRRILKSENYNRMGFKEEKKDVAEMMVSEFTSPLVAELRKNNGVIKRGDVTGIKTCVYI